MDSNGFQGGEGCVQGVMTVTTFAPALGQGHPGLGPLPVPGKAPGACQSLSTSLRGEGRGGVILFKIYFLICKCLRGKAWAPFFQFASKGPRRMSIHTWQG